MLPIEEKKLLEFFSFLPFVCNKMDKEYADVILYEFMMDAKIDYEKLEVE